MHEQHEIKPQILYFSAEIAGGFSSLEFTHGISFSDTSVKQKEARRSNPVEYKNNPHKNRVIELCH